MEGKPNKAPLETSQVTKHKTFHCDACSKSDDELEKNEAATKHCINCKKNLCGACSLGHTKQKIPRDHDVRSIEEVFGKLKPVKTQREARVNSNEDEMPAATKRCTGCKQSSCEDCSRVQKKQALRKDLKVLKPDVPPKRHASFQNKTPRHERNATSCEFCSTKKQNGVDIPPAKSFCKVCRKKLCDDCSRVHTTNAEYKVHELESLDENGEHAVTRDTEKNSEGFECDIKHKVMSSNDEHQGKKTIWDGLVDRKFVAGLLKDETYSKIQKIFKTPHINDQELPNFWKSTLPYIIQRLKMWNGLVISSQNMTALVSRQPRKRGIARDETTFPISRLDCLTFILNTADLIVAQDIMRILAKFSMALTLIMQNIYDSDKYIITLPTLKNTVIKWESTPGQIVENRLFSSPFTMVVAIRLGTNRIGKSTILNQLLKKQFTFSSSGEPGANYGKPRTLNGAVEIVWLTQETCSDATWKNTICRHYKINKEEIAILGNLHGDAIQLPDTLTYLKTLACSFLVFLMPDFKHEDLLKLKDTMSDKHLVLVDVDAKDNSNEEDDIESIDTALLSRDDTQETVRRTLHESLMARNESQSICLKQIPCLGQSLSYSSSLSSEKAEGIVQFVKEHGCFEIKKLLKSIPSSEITSIMKHDKLMILLKMTLEAFTVSTKKKKVPTATLR